MEPAQPRRLRPYRRYALAKAEDNGWTCHYCGCDLDEETITAEHVKARSKGGSHAWKNIVPACNPCNSRKSSLEPEVFLALPPRRGKPGRRRRPVRMPRMQVWNPRRQEWISIGAQNAKKLTPELVESGRYLFR